MMAFKIDTVTARDNLKARHAPYWQKIRSECHLGYRKMTASSMGTWIARYRDEDGKYQLNSLGSLDTLPGHRRFDGAVALAAQWFEHRTVGGSAIALTVRQACERYVKKQRSEGKEAGAKDLEGRFKRLIYPDLKLSATLVTKLTQGMIGDWREKLSTAPALLQDKKKTGINTKAASSINREMAALRAALNLAVRDGHCNSDGAWKYKLTPIKNATGRRDCYLEPDQRRALIANAPADLGALLMALSLVPFRPGAMALLSAGSFDKRLGVLTVGKDKAGADRKINLPPATAAFFAEQAKDKLPGAPLLARADGQFWNKDAWKYPFKDAAKAAGLPAEAVAYSLRHSAITDLIALHKLDTMTVAVLSGTSLAMIEKHYGHLLRDHASNALALLAL
jgi:integrase